MQELLLHHAEDISIKITEVCIRDNWSASIHSVCNGAHIHVWTRAVLSWEAGGKPSHIVWKPCVCRHILQYGVRHVNIMYPGFLAMLLQKMITNGRIFVVRTSDPDNRKCVYWKWGSVIGSNRTHNWRFQIIPFKPHPSRLSDSLLAKLRKNDEITCPRFILKLVPLSQLHRYYCSLLGPKKIHPQYARSRTCCPMEQIQMLVVRMTETQLSTKRSNTTMSRLLLRWW